MTLTNGRKVWPGDIDHIKNIRHCARLYNELALASMAVGRYVKATEYQERQYQCNLESRRLIALYFGIDDWYSAR